MFFHRKGKDKKSKKKGGKKSGKKGKGRKSKKDPSEEFEEHWKKLHEGIYHLVDFLESSKKKPFDLDEYAKLYAIVYNLCTQKVNTGKLGGGPTELLYERYGSAMNEYLEKRVVPALNKVSKETLLGESVKRWRDHQIVVKYMRKVFDYLDRYYTKHNNRDSLTTVGLKVYKELVYGSTKDNMAEALLDQISLERGGEMIDRSAMRDGIGLFIDMGLKSDGKDNLETYKNDFENKLLNRSQQFYKKKSQQWVVENNCPGYMLTAEKKLFEEKSRAESYLHTATNDKLKQKVEQELITKHYDLILNMENSGFVVLMKDLVEKKDDLCRMFRLFNRIKKLQPMADHMRDFVKDEGTEILKKAESMNEILRGPNVVAFIESLIDSHEKFLSLVNHEFKQNHLFKEALKDAFTHIVNTELDNKGGGKTSTAELLSTYCDRIMKTTDKIGEDNLDALFDKIIRLFGYISDKDMFSEFYRRLLSKRLLMGSRTNDDAERAFIAKLKIKCGASFTSKLEGMIKDKSLSLDHQKGFKAFSKDKKKKMNNIEFTPTVLTTGFWPSFKIDALTIPEDIVVCLDCFKDFYDSKTESRILKWVHSLGSCQVQALFSCGKRLLLCSTYQAVILLMFNAAQKGDETVKVKAGAIQKLVNIPFGEVKQNLANLYATKKAMILKKLTGSKKKITADDQFGINDSFRSKSSRIKIPNFRIKITKKEREDVKETTQDDRRYAIDAAVVRIMKARKKMEHRNLVLEVTRQMMSHFKPNPKLIKRRIEDLITREYIERTESASLYRYLA